MSDRRALVVRIDALGPARAVGGRHRAATRGAAEDPIQDEDVLGLLHRGAADLGVLGAHGLHLPPGLFVDDRVVAAGEGVVAVGDEAAVEGVLEQVVDDDLAELTSALLLAAGRGERLGTDAQVVELAGRVEGGARLQVGLERHADDGGLVLVDHENAGVVGVHVVPHGDEAPVPEATLRAGGHAPAGALGRALPLELGEHEGDLQHGAAGWGGGVEGLVDGDEVHAVAVEGGVELVEVQQATGQAVELHRDDGVDDAAADVGEQALDLGAVGVLAGPAFLPEHVGDLPPLGRGPGGDVGAQALLLLFEAALLLGGLAIRGHPQVEAAAVPRGFLAGGLLLRSGHGGDPSSGARRAPVLSW